MYPEIKDYESFDPESFESYYKRWPTSLSNIPKNVVEHWIYQHWDRFQDWRPLNPNDWEYELKDFTNDEILTISPIPGGEHNPHAEGREYLDGSRRSNLPLNKHILESGTIPEPIIIAKNCSGIRHPQQQKLYMSEPYQLIEGTRRLSILFGMINLKYHTLKDTHKVWVVKIRL